MSGKSTYLRTMAIIVILTQVGSFVPASKCEIGIVDRIFTRTGLTDDIHTGKSTFPVSGSIEAVTHLPLIMLV